MIILFLILDLIHVHFFLILNIDWDKDVTVFRIGNSSSTHKDKFKFLVLNERLTLGSDNSAIVAEDK